MRRFIGTLIVFALPLMSYGESADTLSNRADATSSTEGTSAAARSHPTTTGANNVLPVSVRTPNYDFNRALVSVTVCVPGTSLCETVDNVMVDTGSVGLRLQRSALKHPERFAAMAGPDAHALAECYRFVSSAAWGIVTRVDLRLAAIQASSIPIQIVDESNASYGDHPRPDTCLKSSKPTSNGTLGIAAVSLNDCKDPCFISLKTPRYYQCTVDGCTPVARAVAANFRVVHPIAALPWDNNGYVLDVQPVPESGATAARRTLTLGIGTQQNNVLDVTNVVDLAPNGTFTTVWNGQSYPASYFDTGTEEYYFATAPVGAQECGSHWCATPEAEFSATLKGQTTDATAKLRVGDSATLVRSGKGAFRNVAIVAHRDSRAVVWGMPFFIGRKVFVKLNDGSGGSGNAYYAFSNAVFP
ncbi:DUF3443 family protein [bacterium M00.F.Ca.ET.228.01.1.1]|nr:DUF3443 family protein [bacterium M00.F.Ca.ET.228.01.1.1]TGS00154.1 DUF3443 family protein [bacterium M00.F.Ca.ET.191.01.1.1]TGU04475.1 DUF3443 family protein [bacterium M00.F.Ca.ET.155.01.1.1]